MKKKKKKTCRQTIDLYECQITFVMKTTYHQRNISPANLYLYSKKNRFASVYFKEHFYA